MNRFNKIYLLPVVFSLAIININANAAQLNPPKSITKSRNVPLFLQSQRFPTPKAQKQRFVCVISRPNEVHRFGVICNNATFLDVSVADCCIPGDHWEAKVKAWDLKPNTAVTSSPGAANVPGVPARVYNYGGTANSPGVLSAEIDCSYTHGVNVFDAGSTYNVSSDGFCVITDLGSTNEITRTP